MEYKENAKMLLGYIESDDDEDDDDEKMLEYDGGNLDLSSSFGEDDASLIEYKSTQLYPETEEDKITWHEQIRMIQLRGHLNHLLDKVRHAQYIVDMTREELKKCKCQIQLFEDERDRIFAEIIKQESEGNKPAEDRLRSAHEKICKELESEQKLMIVIADKLDQAEYDLALTELERGKFLLAEDDLLQRENHLNQVKAEQAVLRLQKEELLAKQALNNKHRDTKIKNKAKEDAEKRHKHAIEEAEKSQEKANKYLNKTMAKLKQREKEEAERYKSDMSRKMEMLLKLREDIAHNKENLRAILARDKALEEKRKAEEDMERAKIAASGGNPEEVLLLKKRKNEMEKLKQQFEAGQKEKKVEIVQKILREEENIRKKKQQQPYLWEWPNREKTRRVAPIKKNTPKVLEDYIAATSGPVNKEETPDAPPLVEHSPVVSAMADFPDDDSSGESLQFTVMPPVTPDPVVDVTKKERTSKNLSNKNMSNTESDENSLTRPAEEEEHTEKSQGSEDEMAEEETEAEDGEEEFHEAEIMLEETKQEKDIYKEPEGKSESEEEVEPSVDLAKPEFEGLWNKETKLYKAVKDSDQPKTGAKGMSTMEQQILKRTLEKTKKGIVITQVAAGKEFSGSPFYSKPDVIHFKDFDVGKTYKKLVKLTNVSYTLNYIKYLDITDQLKDFIKIQFDPPGQMSAGLTCDVVVTFKPMINKDLSGEVKFLTQTGPFNIPLLCSTKKCDVNVDINAIDFGTHVIGETLRRTITLTNKGALGTNFDFSKVTVKAVHSGGSLAISQSPFELNYSKHSNRIDNLEGKSDVGSEERLPRKSFLNPPSLKPSTPGITQSSDSLPSADITSALSIIVSENKTINEELLEVVEEVVESSPSGEEIAESYDQTEEETEDPSTLDGMEVGPVFAGQIGPMSSEKLEIVWRPTLPGKVKAVFSVYFNDPLSRPISIVAFGNAIDVPVWVERESVDLRICMMDRLYQDTIIIHNRANTALRLNFEVTPELKDYLEILPKTGYIQAQSPFSAQLKFLPRKSLYTDAPKFIDHELGILEAPITINVADQTTPVHFTVHAVVTSTDLEINVSNINFGYCTIHESVRKRFQITNSSILPQQFGFVGLPEWVEVQPNDGFGTILPLETIDLEVIFSPPKADEYSFDLVCRTHINRNFKISCSGIGVHTPLELSQQIVHFGATSLYDHTTASIYVINSHTSSNEFSHPVPRIGKGSICPVGPTSFEFMVPEGAPFTISPSVGTVEPGKKTKINIQFSPTLPDKEIRLEAIKIAEKLEAIKEEKARAEATARESQEKEHSVMKLNVEPKTKRGEKNKNKSNAYEINELNSSRNKNVEEDTGESCSERAQSGSGTDGVSSSVRNPQTRAGSKVVARKKKSRSSRNSGRRNNPKKNSITFGATQNYQTCNESNQNINMSAEEDARYDHNSQSPLQDPHAEMRKANDHPRSNSNNQNETNIQNSIPSTTDLKFALPDGGDEGENFFGEEEGDSEALEELESQYDLANKLGKISKSSPSAITQNKSKQVLPTSTSTSIVSEFSVQAAPRSISKDSPEYSSAILSLVRQFRGQFQSFTVPCYVASGKTGVPGQLEYSIHNTLYLEVHCPAVKSPVVVISDSGSNTLDFGNVSIGQTSQKSVTIQNISDRNIELRASLVNPSGPFLMLNALRPLSPGGTHTILMTFTPGKNQIFQEDFGIKTLNSTLHLTLKGFGISPLVNLSITDGVLDMGAVLSGEYVEKTFTIENTSILSIDYIIKQDSMSPLRYTKAQKMSEFLMCTEDKKAISYVGTQNYNGKNVFDVVQTKGSIAGGEVKEITVTFAPDHESRLYSDGIRLELFDQEESHFFELRGQCMSQMMYLEGFDMLLPGLESLSLAAAVREEEELDQLLAFLDEANDQMQVGPPISTKKPPKDVKAIAALPPALITIQSEMKDDTFQPGVRVLSVGCVRTMAVSQKKNGEFSVEGLQNLLLKGFTVEPQKAMVEAGTKKPLVITWTPPSNFDPNVTLEETATLILKCDVVEQITLMIRCMAVSG